MDFYVYILVSELNGAYYKGFTTDIHLRLLQHNAGETISTRRFRPWKLIYVEQLETKTLALKREKNLKKYSRQRLEVLIQSPKKLFSCFQKHVATLTLNRENLPRTNAINACPLLG